MPDVKVTAVTPDTAIDVVGLVKRYSNSPVNAVDGISFSVRRGECFGLLGPNGAGKSTTIGVLTTRIRPTGGSAFVDGVDVVADPVRARSRIGVVPQRNNLDRSLTIRQNLLFHARYHGVPAGERNARANTLLAQFALTDRADDKPDRLSGGQAQRVMIARALMHSPPVLFLDEPSTGLDPAARLFVWDRIRELAESGVTILLTTHDMDEAETLADRVGIIDHGKLLALDTPQALTHSLVGSATLDVVVHFDGAFPSSAQAPARPSPTGEISPRPDGDVLAELGQLDGVVRVERIAPDGPGLRARLYLTGDPARLVAPVAELVATCGGKLSDVRLGTPTLEDVFIHLTGRALR